MRILIVEDEEKVSSYLRKGLTENSFTVDTADNGVDGLHLAQTGSYDLMILDVMLPGRDGWSIIEEMRRQGSSVPVLFLTARDAVHDRVKGLELGADDYLVKPFSFSELLARVRTVLRRGAPRQAEVLDIADLYRSTAPCGDPRRYENSPHRQGVCSTMVVRPASRGSVVADVHRGTGVGYEFR
jgi:two-component system, OmpR family, copper resistance phosphate regulon response regulator CusR